LHSRKKALLENAGLKLLCFAAAAAAVLPATDSIWGGMGAEKRFF
jgi:hypothetical protein